MKLPAGFVGGRRSARVVRVVAMILAGALSMSAPSARAQTTADDAEALIRQGTELRHNGEDARALPYFEGAYHLSRNPRTAAQLGLVKMALGYCVDAERLLSEALAVPDHPWIARNRVTLEQTRANARKNIGEVTVAGSPDGAQVLVNGRPAGTLPLAAPLRLDRGPAEIQVQARGYAPATRAVTIGGGTRESLSVALERAVAPGVRAAAPSVAPAVIVAAPVGAVTPVAVAAPVGVAAPAGPVQSPAGASERTPWLRPLAWTAGGLAAASVAFAIVETVTAAHRSDDFNNHTGPAPTAADPAHRAPDCQTSQISDDCRAIRDAWQRARTLAIVGYVGAGVFAGTSAALFVLAHRQTLAGWPAAGTEARLACAPTMLVPGLSCAVRF